MFVVQGPTLNLLSPHSPLQLVNIQQSLAVALFLRRRCSATSMYAQDFVGSPDLGIPDKLDGGLLPDFALELIPPLTLGRGFGSIFYLGKFFGLCTFPNLSPPMMRMLFLQLWKVGAS